MASAGGTAGARERAAEAEGGGARGVLASLSDELVAAVERAAPAVVTVDGRRRAPASGVVWPAGPVVLTADHVLEREAEITVSGADGRRLPARLVARDPGSDLAALSVAGGGLAPAELAPPGSLKVGQLVLALGRPGGGASPMASFGVVSALGGRWRTARGGVVEGYVRTDLALLPGFSGGPIVDVHGRVAGIASSHLAAGDAVAIPAAAVGARLEKLLAGGRVRRGYLGVSLQLVELQPALRQRLALDQATGLMLVGLEPGGPAERGGLLMGDILLALAGRPLADGEALQMALGPEVVGRAVEARVVRGGETRELALTPAERAG